MPLFGQTKPYRLTSDSLLINRLVMPRDPRDHMNSRMGGGRKEEGGRESNVRVYTNQPQPFEYMCSA